MTTINRRDVQILPAGRIGGALLCLCLLASWPARAVVCTINTLGSPGVCAEVAAGIRTLNDGDYDGEPIPFNTGYMPGFWDVSVLAGGGGGDAQATASAALGLLRLTAASTSSATYGSGSFARATASFSDYGDVRLPGATIGDVVHGSVTIDLQGTHTTNAGLMDSSFYFESRQNGELQNNFLLSRPDGLYGVYDFILHVGDTVITSFGMSIFADSSYLQTVSNADYGNSAHFYVDFDEPGAYFGSDSGHDYSSAAAVPAPPAVWLLGTALAGLGGRRWCRRKAAT